MTATRGEVPDLSKVEGESAGPTLCVLGHGTPGGSTLVD